MVYNSFPSSIYLFDPNERLSFKNEKFEFLEKSCEEDRIERLLSLNDSNPLAEMTLLDASCLEEEAASFYLISSKEILFSSDVFFLFLRLSFSRVAREESI